MGLRGQWECVCNDVMSGALVHCGCKMGVEVLICVDCKIYISVCTCINIYSIFRYS